MKLFKSAIVAVLVFFGLGMTVDLDAQTVWVDRYEAVDALGAEWLALPDNPNQLSQQEVAALNTAYPQLMKYLDREEDTQEGWVAFEQDLDDEYNRRGGGFDSQLQRLKDHLLSIISE